MKIVLQHISKKYNHNWIFKNVSLELYSNETYGIIGNNGSGKSTLLQIIAGNIIASKGEIYYETDQAKIPAENIYNFISIAAPYLELIENFTLYEMLQFHGKLKKLLPSKNIKEIVQMAEFSESVEKKKIKDFSTGMKQKAKLLIAIFTESPVLLLDEPCTNLDSQAIHWFHNLINTYANNRLLLICSNSKDEEMSICNHRIAIAEYKY